jgi:hypothetical protein
VDHLNNVTNLSVNVGCAVFLPSSFQDLHVTWRKNIMMQRRLWEDSVSHTSVSHHNGMKKVFGDLRKSFPYIAADRSSSLVAGVFSVKLETVIKDATKSGVFGQMNSYVYTVYFRITD